MSQHSSRGRQWNELRQEVFRRDNHLCTYCLAAGLQVQATHCDHIIPKSLGGTDTMDNLTSACRDCNLKKGSRLVVRQSWLNPRFFGLSGNAQDAR